MATSSPKRPLPQKPTPKPWYTKITRDVILFTAGLGIILNEAFIREGPERLYIIGASLGMMGLPAFLNKDERGQQ